MIYFTTFIFALLLSHIARAVPACGDAASPEDLYDPTYDDVQEPIDLLVTSYKVGWDGKYDKKHGDTKSVACANPPHGYAHRYPHFKDFPDFPYIGGAFDVKHGSPNCGKCWKLHDKKTNKSIHLTAIDHAGHGKGFIISKEAFEKLNGGSVGSGELEAEAKEVPASVCGFK
jgi:hypothetical protein